MWVMYPKTKAPFIKELSAKLTEDFSAPCYPIKPFLLDVNQISLISKNVYFSR